MSHPEQVAFCESVRDSIPNFFRNRNVLDCGSLDINGNNRYLFTDCNYLGIDIGHGKNVDIVSKIHEFNARDGMFDTIISTECLEHDMFWKASFHNMVRMLSPGGLLLFTCATTGRHEHGTRRTTPGCAPFVSSTEGLWQDYYKNLTAADFEDFFNMDAMFSEYMFTTDENVHDLRFTGIRRTSSNFLEFVKRK